MECLDTKFALRSQVLKHFAISEMASRMLLRVLQESRCKLHAAYSTKPTNAQKIGIIGLGTVGSKVTTNLLKAGFTVSALHDCDASAGKHLPENIPRTKTPRELAEICDVVMTALPAPPHVRDVMTGDNGVLAGLRAGGVWIDHTTTDYQQTLELAEAAGRFFSNELASVLFLWAPAFVRALSRWMCLPQITSVHPWCRGMYLS